MINRLLDVANKYPDKTAYSYLDNDVSYKELVEKARELSKKLKRLETNNVVLYGHKEIFMTIAMIACLMANKTYIPIDYYFPRERIKTILKDLKDYIVISNKTNENFKTYPLNDIPEQNGNCKTDVAYLIFTSGSTGKPKGVPISRTNLECFINWISGFYPLNVQKRLNIYDQASFSFDLSVADFYYGLLNGHSLVSSDEKIVNIDFLKEKEINALFVTPSYLRVLSFDQGFNEDYLKSLKIIYCCGEQFTKNLAEKIYRKFPNIKLINAYGPSEATSAVSAYYINKEKLQKFELIPCGVIGNTSCDISIDKNEIVLKGDSVFKGYLKSDADLSTYHTADYGEIVDGLLFCKGRKDRQIKYLGNRIELDEIENVLLNLNIVENAMVDTVVDDYNNVQYIKAKVVPNRKCDIVTIKERLSKYLPEYMIPREIELVVKIEISDNGKIR